MANYLYANRVGISTIIGTQNTTLFIQDLLDEVSIDLDTGIILVKDTMTGSGKAGGYIQGNESATFKFTINPLADSPGFDPNMTRGSYWFGKNVSLTFFQLLPNDSSNGQVGNGATYTIENATIERVSLGSRGVSAPQTLTFEGSGIGYIVNGTYTG